MKYLANVATLSLLPGKCTGCGKCIEVCPHEVFVLRDKKISITDQDKCMECGACAANCPFGALHVDKGVGCATAIINSMLTGGEPTCGCSGGNSRGGCC